MWPLVMLLACEDASGPERPVVLLPDRYALNRADPTRADYLEEVQRVDERGLWHDGFVFWGWSSDHRRFAYETSWRTTDPGRCEGEVVLRVVDLASGEVVPGGRLAQRPHREHPPCERLDAAMRAQRGPFLEGHGVVVGLAVYALHFSAWGELVDHHGDRYTLDLRALGPGRADPPTGAGLVALLRPDQGAAAVLETGARTYPFTYGFRPYMAFPSPDTRGVAVFLKEEVDGPAGPRLRATHRVAPFGGALRGGG